jgi:hypothetical protein
VINVVLMALSLHLHHLISRAASFDEHFQLHFLWLTGNGILPRDDFLCPYPPAAYYLFGPLISLLPEEPRSFLLVRMLTLAPLLVVVGTLAAVARHLGRHTGITIALALALVASGTFPPLWEIRFDLLSRSICFVGVYLLLTRDDARHIAAAAGLAVLSLVISPKHVFFVTGLALAYLTHLALSDRRHLPRAVLAALLGALVPLAFLTLLRPAFFSDTLDLAVVNFRAQLTSTYPDNLIESLLGLFMSDPVATSPVWAGPVIFLLHCRSLPSKSVRLYLGMLAGALVTLLTLPCGYEQYTTLVWGLCTILLPVMSPRRDDPWLALAASVGLLALMHVYSARDAAPSGTPGMTDHLALQEELARLCPPGEVSAAAPFAHAWFRRNPGYVFIDNVPSYEQFVRPARRPLFSAAYYLKQLEAQPPAYFCGFTTRDSVPAAYTQAITSFLERQQTNYVIATIPCPLHIVLKDGRLPLVVRKDLAGRMVNRRVEP